MCDFVEGGGVMCGGGGGGGVRACGRVCVCVCVWRAQIDTTEREESLQGTLYHSNTQTDTGN